MDDAVQAQGKSHSSKARLVWVLGFAVITCVAGMLLSHNWKPPPSVRLSTGTVFTFVAITQPTPPSSTSPTSSGTVSTTPRHISPRSHELSWWQKRYQKIWAASPAWLKRSLPAPYTAPVTNWDPFGWRYGVPNYQMWLEATGVDYTHEQWSIAVNGSSARGWSYGADTIWTFAAPIGTSPASAPPPPRKWLRVNLDALPPTTVQEIKVEFVPKGNGSISTLKIPNPAYRADAK